MASKPRFRVVQRNDGRLVIDRRRPIGVARITRIVKHFPFMIEISIKAGPGARLVEHGQEIEVFGVGLLVRSLRHHDGACDYTFRARVTAFSNDLRSRAILLQAHEKRKPDRRAKVWQL